jgi:hypothetical protein
MLKDSGGLGRGSFAEAISPEKYKLYSDWIAKDKETIFKHNRIIREAGNADTDISEIEAQEDTLKKELVKEAEDKVKLDKSKLVTKLDKAKEELEGYNEEIKEMRSDLEKAYTKLQEEYQGYEAVDIYSPKSLKEAMDKYNKSENVTSGIDLKLDDKILNPIKTLITKFNKKEKEGPKLRKEHKTLSKEYNDELTKAINEVNALDANVAKIKALDDLKEEKLNAKFNKRLEAIQDPEVQAIRKLMAKATLHNPDLGIKLTFEYYTPIDKDEDENGNERYRKIGQFGNDAYMKQSYANDTHHKAWIRKNRLKDTTEAYMPAYVEMGGGEGKKLEGVVKSTHENIWYHHKGYDVNADGHYQDKFPITRYCNIAPSLGETKPKLLKVHKRMPLGGNLYSSDIASTPFSFLPNLSKEKQESYREDVLKPYLGESYSKFEEAFPSMLAVYDVTELSQGEVKEGEEKCE